MKHLVILAALCFWSFSEKPAHTYDPYTLTVTVEGIEGSEGVLHIGLYNDEGEFPEGEPSMAEEVTLNGEERITVTFEGVPPGIYSSAVMHDANENGKVDMDERGIPMEGYGFSNDATGDMGPPSYDDASFTVEEDTEVTLRMVYLHF